MKRFNDLRFRLADECGVTGIAELDNDLRIRVDMHRTSIGGEYGMWEIRLQRHANEAEMKAKKPEWITIKNEGNLTTSDVDVKMLQYQHTDRPTVDSYTKPTSKIKYRAMEDRAEMVTDQDEPIY